MRFLNFSSSNLLGIMFLILVFVWTVQGRNRSRKSPRSTLCSRGCISCDGINGCLKCRPRMFLFLSAIANRQVGICKHNCPSGYFGERGRPINKCTKCDVPNCKTCFTQSYCTSCQSKFFLFDSKCDKKCPTGMAGSIKTGKCEDKVDCIVGAWSSWSKCARRASSRSCKYGRKKRKRIVVQKPSKNGKKCPKLKEGKRCLNSQTNCILFNKRLERMGEIIKKLRERKTRKKGKRGKNKKRKRKYRIETNSTVRQSDKDNNMASLKPRTSSNG